MPKASLPTQRLEKSIGIEYWERSFKQQKRQLESSNCLFVAGAGIEPATS